MRRAGTAVLLARHLQQLGMVVPADAPAAAVSSPPAADRGRRRRGPVTPEEVTGPRTRRRSCQPTSRLAWVKSPFIALKLATFTGWPKVEAWTIWPLPMYMAT